MQQTEVSTKTLCDICGKEGAAFFSRTHSFLKTCVEHNNEYHNRFNVEKIRFELGLIAQIPDCNCDICEKPLSEDEKHSMSLDDFNKTCEGHRIWAKYFNSHPLKEAYKRGELPTEIPPTFTSDEDARAWAKTPDGQIYLKAVGFGNNNNNMS